MLQQIPPKRGNAARSQGMFLLTRLLNRCNGFIAGGYARWALSPHKDSAPPNDIDIFFEREKDFFHLEDIFEGMRMRRSYSSNNAVSYSWHLFPLPLHLVRINYGTPENILNSFDFGICQAALIGNEGFALPSFLEEEERKELRIKTLSPLSMDRVNKYIGRGYWISYGERAKVKSRFTEEEKEVARREYESLMYRRPPERREADENCRQYPLYNSL